MPDPLYPDPSQTQLPNPNPNRQPIQPTAPLQPVAPAYPPSIDPNASAPPAAAPAPAPAQPTGPARPSPVPGTGQEQIDSLTGQQRQALADARQNVDDIWVQIQKVQGDYDKVANPPGGGQPNLAQLQTAGTQLNQQLTALNARMAQAQQTVANANDAYSSTLVSAMQKVDLDPALKDKYTKEADLASAQADTARANAKVITDGAPSQQALTVAQAANQNAAARAQDAAARRDDATAAATLAKTPDEQKQLQANAAALNAQAQQYTAQATQINALLPGLIDKQKADTSVSVSQAGLNDANSDLAKANAVEAGARTNYANAQADYQRSLIPGAPGLQAAQTAAAAGQGAQAQAAAQQTLADIQAKKLGPAYGLQDQIDAIQSVVQNVFHNPANAGKSPDELKGMADDLLKQYTTAAIGGTTPYAASVAAANYQQNQNATQMSGVNAMQAAMANRANAYAGLGGSVLGQLGQMNQYAPKGTTTGAAAFQQVMDQMAQRLASPQFAPVNLPQPSPLPPFLQAFAAGHQAGQQQANAQPQSGGQQAPTVNINVNGQPQGGGAPNATPSPVITPPATLANSTNAAFANGLAQGAGSPIPAFANNYMAFAQPMNMIGYRGVF